MGVNYSSIGKVKTGGRHLDIIEFIQYCAAMGLDPSRVIEEIKIKVLLEEGHLSQADKS